MRAFATGGANGDSGLLDADCPDVYFTSAYGAATALVDSGTWQVVHEQDQLILPYVSRPASEIDVDAATLAALQAEGIVSEGSGGGGKEGTEWAGPTGTTTNWAGPTSTTP